MSCAEVGAADPEIIVVGEKFDAQGRVCPPEARGWLVLAYFSYSLVALDPTDGRVYSFPEGEDSWNLLPLRRVRGAGRRERRCWGQGASPRERGAAGSCRGDDLCDGIIPTGMGSI